MPPLKNSYFINTIYLFMKMIIVMITVDSMKTCLSYNSSCENNDEN